jgi:hypothetical protein
MAPQSTRVQELKKEPLNTTNANSQTPIKFLVCFVAIRVVELAR